MIKNRRWGWELGGKDLGMRQKSWNETERSGNEAERSGNETERSGNETERSGNEAERSGNEEGRSGNEATLEHFNRYMYTRYAKPSRNRYISYFTIVIPSGCSMAIFGT